MIAIPLQTLIMFLLHSNRLSYSLTVAVKTSSLTMFVMLVIHYHVMFFNTKMHYLSTEEMVHDSFMSMGTILFSTIIAFAVTFIFLYKGIIKH